MTILRADFERSRPAALAAAYVAANEDDNREAMSLLCESFPALRGAPGVRPWNQHRIAGWASQPISEGEALAAQFVLAVWNGFTPLSPKAWWNSRPHCAGVFDAVRAIHVWDQANRDAFLAWCANPFRP